MEVWRDCWDFPNHEFSSYGRVRNKKTGYVLKQFPDRYGYLRVSVGSVDNVYIHMMVCKLFHGEPHGNRTQVNHIDTNRQNNHADNLEWVTPRENITHAYQYGNLDPSIGLRRAVEVNRKPVRIVETGQVFESVKDCAEYLGVKPTGVSRVLVGSRKGQRIHGYSLEFI